MLFSRPLQAAAAPVRRRTWLGSTALLASLAVTAAPSEALAACVGENTGSVTCDAANPATGGTLESIFAGTTVITVNPGAKIDGFALFGNATFGGASVTVTAPGSLTFTNSDTIFGIANMVNLRNAFGDISYMGNAAASGIGAQAADGTISIFNTAAIGTGGLQALTTGNGKIIINSDATVNGPITGLSNGAGDVSISGSGSVTSTTAGIGASTAGLGNATITYNGPITSTDAALFASTVGGNATVTGSGSVTSADAIGTIRAWADFNGNGNALIAWNGTVNNTGTGAGLYADAGAGSATVNVLGNVTSTGVRAASQGGTATVTVANGLTLNGAQNAIDVGAPFGNANLVVGDGASISASVDAIFAHTITGNTTATIGAGTTVSGGIGGGLVVQTPGGIATVTIGAGAILSGDSGGIGVAAGSGSLTIGNGANVTAPGLGGFGVGVHVRSDAGFTMFNAGIISGSTAAIRFIPNGGLNTLTLAPTSVIVGQVIGGASSFQIPLGDVPGVADTLQLGGTGTGSFDISHVSDAGQYSGFGTFNKVDSSNWILTGTSSFAGPIAVNGGTLSVNGDITSAGSLAVNPGGTLGGTGVVGATAINGGTLAPGNSIGTLMVNGSLTLTAASTYLVQISGTSSDLTVVTGTANLAGRVTVDALARVNVTTTYTIMTAGTVNGTFDAAGVLAGNSFARNARVSYVGNDVLLTVDPGLLSPNLPANANINQINVATGIDNALLAGVNMPAGFNALFALTGSGLANALTQVSGETATGSQQATFDAMNLFMGVMTDPFTAGRGGNAPGTSGFAEEDNANAYAANGRKRSGAEREAFAMFAKAPPRAFEARWNMWAAGFGGSQTTDGNATLGSNTATSRVGGVAVGADYWLTPQTVAGFALAGGGTNFSINGAGSGRSDLFQAGAFVRHTIGSAYITAAAAYGWQDITTDRTVTIAGVDRLRAQFNANAFSGRVEGGNRYVLPWTGGMGLTPYAAVQATAFDLPGYGESVVSGANTFALAYAAKTVTATRSELGLRTDKSWAMPDSILTLRGRAAWAHDYNTDRSIGATFQTLPGASFVVNGAAQSPDKALTTASAEVKWRSGLSLAATFEGEFSGNSTSYAGKGVARYAW